jgi:hypothetical protein
MFCTLVEPLNSTIDDFQKVEQWNSFGTHFGITIYLVVFLLQFHFQAFTKIYFSTLFFWKTGTDNTNILYIK